MQALVAVRFRHGEPVAQTLGVRLVHVGHNRVDLPTLHLLFLQWRVENYAYGEEVVDAFKLATLLLHLLPDRVNALGAAFHVKLQACFFQLCLYRANKLLYISVASLFRGVELVFNHVVGIVLKILQTEIFELTLQLIKTELVSEWGIKVTSLLAHLHFCFFVLCVPNLSHEVHAVSNHYKNNAHVLGKGEQQVSEILAFNNRVLAVELMNAHQSVNYEAYTLSKHCSCLFYA